MFNLKIETDFSSLEKSLAEIKKDKEWLDIAKKIEKKLKSLIAKSKNMDGKTLKDYANSTEIWRESKGLSTTVDFKVTGQMIRSISVKIVDDGFQVFLKGAENNKKMINISKRKNWTVFNWGKELIDELEKEIGDLLVEVGL